MSLVSCIWWKVTVIVICLWWMSQLKVNVFTPQSLQEDAIISNESHKRTDETYDSQGGQILPE